MVFSKFIEDTDVTTRKFENVKNEGSLIVGANGIIDDSSIEHRAGYAWQLGYNLSSPSATVTLRGGALWLSNDSYIDSASYGGKYVMAAPKGYTVPSGFSTGAYIELARDDSTSLVVDFKAGFLATVLNGNATINGKLAGAGNILYDELSKFSGHLRGADVDNITIGVDSEGNSVPSNVVIAPKTVLFTSWNVAKGTISVNEGSSLNGSPGSIIVPRGSKQAEVDLGTTPVYDARTALTADSEAISGIQILKGGAAGTALYWQESQGPNQNLTGWFLKIIQ